MPETDPSDKNFTECMTLPYPKGKRPTDHLYATFNDRRYRFKVVQLPLARLKVSLELSGEKLSTGAGSRYGTTRRGNIIWVDLDISAQQFYETVKKTISQKFKVTEDSISLKFEKGNIIKLRDNHNVRNVKNQN